MKSNTVQQAVLEMADGVAGNRIQKIQLLDFCTPVFDLYGHNGLLLLAVSLKKSDCGFHLLFKKVNSAYLYQSPASQQLYALVRGFRIVQLQYIEQCAVIMMRSSSVRYLVFDFRAFNALVLNENGEIVFRLLKNKQKADFSHIRSIAKRILANGEKDSGLGDMGNQSFIRIKKRKGTASSGGLPLNRELSAQFFKKRSESLVHGALKVIKSEQKKAARLLEKLQLEAEELENSETIRIYGELLKYNLSKVRKGASSVSLKDFQGNDIEVRLDPARSPTENMHRYFERYKKLGRKKEVFKKKFEYETKRLSALNSLLRNVTDKKAISLNTPPAEVIDLLQVEYFKESFRRRVANVLIQRPIGRSFKKEEAKGEFLRFTSGTGKVMLVGKNARENEELAIRNARGNDLWFHIEDGTGSAVVLRYDKKCAFQETDIADAAALALYFSKIRAQGAGTVVYTYCKYVKKPKGTKPGYVIYHKNKTRYTVLDEKVLARLIDSKIPIMASAPRGLKDKLDT